MGCNTVANPSGAMSYQMRTLSRVDLPELPPAQFARDEHTGGLCRSTEGEHDGLLCALHPRTTLLSQLYRVLGELKA